MAQNFSVYRGDDLTLTLNFTGSTGEIIDISGWKIYFTIKRDVSVLDEDATGFDGTQKSYIINNGTSGIATVYLTALETTILEDEFLYDIEIIDATGIVVTVLYGSIEFISDITRAVT
jgi:hypothetical protein